MQKYGSEKVGVGVVNDQTMDGMAPSEVEEIERGIGKEGLNAVVYKHIVERSANFLEHGHRTIYASDLMKRMEKGEKLFLLDIRLSENFEAGHIPGSVNVEFIDVMEPRNMALLPKDQTPIIIICYTGHTASQLNAVLNLLGMNAWTLRLGMLSWNAMTKTSVWSAKNIQQITGAAYPVVTVSHKTEVHPPALSNSPAVASI